MTIAEKVRAIITVNCSDNRMETVFRAEKLSALGANVPVILEQLEKEFNVDLDDEFAKHWETVADVIRDVENLVSVHPAYASVATIDAFGKTSNERPVSFVPGYGHLDITAKMAEHNLQRVINRIERDDVHEFQDQLSGFDPRLPNALDHYQQIATKSAIYPGKGTPFGLMYVALGLAEAGEVQNKVKKAFRDDNIMEFEWNRAEASEYPDDPSARTDAYVKFNPLTTERKKQIVKELGGVFWYFATTCNEIGVKMSEVALSNLDELCGRTERNTLSGDGDER